jgi:hypothetical protein
VSDIQPDPYLDAIAAQHASEYEPDVPQAAVAAAAQALRNEGTLGQLEALAAIVLEAAAPLIAAAERERMRQAAADCEASVYDRDRDEWVPLAGLMTDLPERRDKP